MSRFKHTHVMGLIGVCLDAGPAPYIVMPYMANGSLLKYLKRERKNLVFTDDADEDDDEVGITIVIGVQNVPTYSAIGRKLCIGTRSTQVSGGDVFSDS